MRSISHQFALELKRRFIYFQDRAQSRYAFLEEQTCFFPLDVPPIDLKVLRERTLSLPCVSILFTQRCTRGCSLNREFFYTSPPTRGSSKSCPSSLAEKSFLARCVHRRSDFTRHENRATSNSRRRFSRRMLDHFSRQTLRISGRPI